MDELSEDDKLTVSRARKMRRFPISAFLCGRDLLQGFQEICNHKDTIRVSKKFLMVSMMIYLGMRFHGGRHR